MRKNKIKYNCYYCGKECETQVSRYNMSKGKHYCNKDCYWAYNRGKNHYKYAASNIQCDCCGKDIEVNQYEVGHRKNHFCSKECHSKWMLGRGGESHHNYRKQEVLCVNCGKVLLRTLFEIKKNEYHYCDRICMGKHRSKILVGNKHPSWKGGLITVCCIECGSNVAIKKYRLGNNIFCNHECHGKWISENFKGENSWNWKGGINAIQNTIRASTKMKRWIQTIYKRDNYVCQKCNKGSNKLNIHHLDSVSKILKRHNILTIENALACDELWDLENGITLCKNCHKEFHRKYGVRRFTQKDYYEWIKMEVELWVA